MIFQFIVQNGQGGLEAVAPSSSSFPVVPLIVAVLFAVIMISMAVHRLVRFLQRPDLHGMDRKRILETWANIEKTAEHGTMGAKLAVIEADKLLDGVLKSMMMPGETLGERLKTAGYKYPGIRQVWGAHRLRNQLVHDSSFDLSIRQAKGALRDYRAALETLNVF